MEHGHLLIIAGLILLFVWQASAQKDDVIVIYTDVSLTENGNLVHVEDKRNFNFRLRACAHGIVYLRESSDYTLRKWIQVELGYDKNSRSRIKVPSGKVYTSLSTPNILHCSEFRTFWVDWVQNNIRVGHGPSPGYQVFLSADIPDEDNFDRVISISLSTAEGYAGTWEVDAKSGREVSVTTPADESFRWLWRTLEGHQNFLSFSVDACVDVVIGLGRELGKTEYTVTLARKPGNEHSIQKNMEKQVAFNASDVDSCAWSAAFWVGWDDGLISAGRGLFKGRDTIIEWNDNEFESIGALAFGAKSNNEQGADAIWDFIFVGGNSYTFFSNPAEKEAVFDHWIYAPRDHSIRFHVDGCREAMIALSPEPGSDDFEETLYVVLGAEANSRCRLLDHAGKELHSVKAEHVLGCNIPRPFWITWRDGAIKLGQGASTGTSQIFSKDLKDLDKLSAVGFGNVDQTGAFWVARPVAGDKVILSTNDDVNATTTWVPIPLQAYIEFSLTTETDGYIYLYEAQGIYQEGVVTVVIGYDNDKRGVAFLEDGRLQTRCRCDEDVLTPDEARAFYILSTSTIVSLVTEEASENQRCTTYVTEEYGENSLASMTADIASSAEANRVAPEVAFDETGEEVKVTKTLCSMRSRMKYNARSLGLASKEPAKWEFQIDSGDEIRFTSMEQTLYDSWRWFELTKASSGITFRAKGTEMSLLLSEGYMNETAAFAVTMTTSESYIEKENSREDGKFTLAKGQVRDYWIMWKAGAVTMGISEVPGKNVQLSWSQSTDVTITAIAVKIPNIDTEFRFIKGQAVEVQFVTSPAYYNNQMWIQMRQERSMIFALKSCKSAEIGLAAVMGTSEVTYRMKIGTDGNSKTAITRDYTTHPMIEVPSPEILSCDEERYFWLMWGGGELALGKGTEMGRDIVVNWYDLAPQPVTAVQFITGQQNPGDWRVRLDEGRDFEDKTSPGDKTTPPPEPTSPSKGGMSSGDAAGVVIGVLIILILVMFGVYVMMRGLPGPLEDLWYSVTDRFSSNNQPQQFANEA